MRSRLLDGVGAELRSCLPSTAVVPLLVVLTLVTTMSTAHAANNTYRAMRGDPPIVHVAGRDGMRLPRCQRAPLVHNLFYFMN